MHIRNLRHQAKNEKTKEKRWNMLGQKGRSNARKNNNKTRRNKPEVPGKRRETKKISR